MTARGYVAIGADSKDTGCAAACDVIQGGAKVGAVLGGVPVAVVLGCVTFTIPGFVIDACCGHLCTVGAVAAVPSAKAGAAVGGTLGTLGGGAAGGILSGLFCAPCAFFGCKPACCDNVNQAITSRRVLNRMSKFEDSLHELGKFEPDDKWFSPPQQLMP